MTNEKKIDYAYEVDILITGDDWDSPHEMTAPRILGHKALNVYLTNFIRMANEAEDTFIIKEIRNLGEYY